ncbi:MAG: glycine betaine/L-proline ABC transporter substrate-binding protein ProX [Acidimicrobiia bacterium]|nr:glycine betaine/L-proline ABC transporter substrate-binding protein ProX [Acidimicrobiia bacterium]
MRKRPTLRLLTALLFTMGLVAAACGTDDDGDTNDTGTNGQNGDAAAMPGEGVSVEMARADWSTGYFQAAVYKALLEELGYEVSDPSQNELGPTTFYPALAQREYDFWVNGWFPLHEEFFDADVPGGTASDFISPVGMQIEAGALQGYLVDKATADEYDITTLEQIVEDPELNAMFDIDGDGVADILGCDEGWGCQVTIEDTIEENGWSDSIKQVSATHAALFADAVARVQDGEPTLVYVWTPSAFITELVPGEDVIWLGLENPLPAQEGAADLPEDQCPADPCEMGFVANDIRVVANNDFLEENPAAAALFEAVVLSVTDVAIQNVEMDAGEDTQADIDRQAAEWIENNRDTVDEWLAAARAAA